jgi:hypothetical protein
VSFLLVRYVGLLGFCGLLLVPGAGVLAVDADDLSNLGVPESIELRESVEPRVSLEMAKKN